MFNILDENIFNNLNIKKLLILEMLLPRAIKIWYIKMIIMDWL